MASSAKKLGPTGPFPTLPGKRILDEFRAWVAETGQPDLWRFHEPSTPPRDQDFEELLRFEIPEKKRPDVGMATCPICSPAAPKYYEGALAWFLQEGVLRAIGHECAKSHFGVQRHNAAVAKRRHREAVEIAQDFLLDTLPKIAPLREEVEALERVARHVDTLRQTIWHHCSKTACLKLARMGTKGILTVEETQEITTVDIYGKEQTRSESRITASFPVAGLGFLSQKFSVLAQARNTAVALQQIKALDQEAALQFICEELAEQEYLFQAEKLARAAVEGADRIKAAIKEARDFFYPGNLHALSEWSADYRSGAPIHFIHDDRDPWRIQFRKPGKESHAIVVPNTLKPSVADLDT